MATQAEVGFRGPDQLAWASVLGSERDNVRSAIEWALASGRGADASAIIAGLSYGWYVGGAASEGRLLVGSVLAHGDAGSVEHAALAHTWFAWLSQFTAGMTADVAHHAERGVELARGTTPRVFGTAAVVASLVRGFQGRTDAAVELIDEAAAQLAGEPDAWAQAWVDWASSGLALKAGNSEEAATLLRRSVEGFASEGDRCGLAVASIRLSELAEGRGDHVEAIAAATAAYEMFLAFGVQAFNASTLATRLGNLAAGQGRFDDASDWHDHALSRAQEGAYPGAIAQALSGMARAAVLQGRADDAEAWHREALAIYRTTGSVEGAAASLASLGSIAAGKGDHRRAVELYEQSLAQASLGRDQRAIALAAEGMAGSAAVLAHEALVT